MYGENTRTHSFLFATLCRLDLDYDLPIGFLRAGDFSVEFEL